ncbi:hypothetical protein RN629_15135 [Sphingomonadaceae bacterium jetA1]|jgi:hypothetical protein|uniref:hypothetical protein n=1 Tax=Facivitalis istanbulensis TaxID=3075838 RepID=UPI0034837B40
MIGDASRTDIAPRWSGSGWAILRQGAGALLPGGQLGGSQFGVGVLRRLDRRGALAASLRVSAPWEGIGREMALGVDWRPSSRLPVRLLIEQRIALDRGQGGPAVLAVGGIGPRRLAAGLSLTGYAQAGMVARDRIEPFADGAMRMTRDVAEGLDMGLGLWGGAQRGVARVDIGPMLGAALPLPGAAMRLSLEWRQRVAGHAAPGSGPTLSLASDF